MRATLAAAGQAWIDDPSNANVAYARVRCRRLGPLLAAEGLTPARLAATARRLGRARAALEGQVAGAAWRHVFLHPAGFALVEGDSFARLPEEIGLRLLARLALAVGGGAYPPRLERLERLYDELRGSGRDARTLAGCHLVWQPDGKLLVCREPAKVAGPLALAPGKIACWDGRFRLAVAIGAPPGVTVAALGIQGWRAIGRRVAGALPAIPAAARPTLPAITDEEGVCAVPHLGYNRDPGGQNALEWIVPVGMNPLTVAGRCLV